MAFVRTKRVGDYEYYQLVQSVRVGGKPRQKVLLHLDGHPTVEDALKKWPREIRRLRRRAQREHDMALEGTLLEPVDRNALRRGARLEKQADDLEANLKKLRDLRKRGVV